MRAVRWLLIACAATSGCADMTALDAGVCGNGVVDAPHEDCDSVAAPGLSCGDSREARKACRFVCAGPSACPGGWACSPDGVCVHGSGSFEPGPSTAAAFGEWALGDADGDGVLDLAGTHGKTLELRHGDGKGSFVDERTRAIEQSGEAWLGDADGDGLLEAAVPTSLGMVLFRGDPERHGFVPSGRASPGYGYGPSMTGVTEIWGTPATVPPAWQRPEGSAYADIESECDGGFVLVARSQKGLFGLTAPVPVEGYREVSIDGSVCGESSNPSCFGARAGRLEPPPGAPDTRGSSLLVAPAAADHAVLATIGVVDGWPDVSSTEQLELPDDLFVTPSGIALAGPAKPTGEVELFVPAVEKIGARHLLRATRDASGAMGDLSVDARFDPKASGPCMGHPLALADFDADGELDFVLPGGVCRGMGSSEPLAPTELKFPSAWQEAAVADFDGDGNLDLAGLDAERASVELLYLDGQWGYARVSIPAEEPRLVRAAQMDGLAGSDLVYVVPYGTDRARVLVAFGEPTGLTAPEVAGVWEGVARVEPARLRDPLGRCDAIMDLLLTKRGAVVPVFGSADRAVYAPILLSRMNIVELPIGVVLGKSEVGAWMLALAEGPYGTGSQYGLDDAFGSDTATVEYARLDAVTCGDARPRFTWTMADSDGDGADEAIGVEGICPDVPSSALTRIELLGPNLIRHEWSLPIQVAALQEIAAADLDRDGSVDLALARSDGLWIVWGSKDGWSPARVDPGEARSLGLLGADAEQGKELAVLGPGAAVVLTFQGRTSQELSRIELPASADLVRTGDVNGDGVDDLAVSDGKSVRTFFGVAHQATGLQP